MLLLYITGVCAFECILDADCRRAEFPGYNTRYCVKNMCREVRRPGDGCTLPTQCASFSYYGPLACSSSCKKQSGCSNLNGEHTRFCCKAVPLKGECEIGRPRNLSGCASSHKCMSINGSAKCVEREEKSWVFAAACSICGNVLINAGINYQKKSYVQSNLSIVGHQVNTLVFGSMVYAAGKFISFMAYVFGSQSMLAGLSATGLISNSIFAPLINNETFTWKDGVAILLVLAGTSVILHNTARSHVVYSLCELINMYKNKGTILWFSFVILSIGLMFIAIKFVEVNSDWDLPGHGFHFLKADIFFDADGFICKYVMVFVYVLISSFIASFTTLSAKSLGEIIGHIIGGDPLIRNGPFYLFLSTLVGCTLLQIYWLNRALRHYDALLVVPIFHITWTILSILTAGIYFQDFDHYSSTQFRYFMVGVLIIFIGSVFLGSRITARSRVETRPARIQEEMRQKDD